MILKLNLSSGFDVLQSTIDIMLYTTQAVNRIKKESIFNFISFYIQRLILFTFHINTAAESSNDVSNLKWLLMLRIFFLGGHQCYKCIKCCLNLLLAFTVKLWFLNVGKRTNCPHSARVILTINLLLLSTHLGLEWCPILEAIKKSM